VFRITRILTVLALVLAILFLSAWVTSMCGCASEAHKHVRSQYPPNCETKSLGENSRLAIIEVRCPGREPVVEKVRKK